MRTRSLRIAYHLVGPMNECPNLSELGVLEVVPPVAVLNVSVTDKLSKDRLRSWGSPPNYMVLCQGGVYGLSQPFPPVLMRIVSHLSDV